MEAPPPRIELVAVLPDLAATTAEAAIAQVGAALAQVAGEGIVAALAQREQVASTYLGHETALPHCRLPGVRALQVVLARSPSGIAWGAGGERARLVCASVIPPDAGVAYLGFLQKVAAAVRQAPVRGAALAAVGEDGLRAWATRTLGLR